MITINKITHMWKRRGTPQNFSLALIDELERQLLKKLLKSPNSKCKNFNVYNTAFKKKLKKDTWRYN